MMVIIVENITVVNMVAIVIDIVTTTATTTTTTTTGVIVIEIAIMITVTTQTIIVIPHDVVVPIGDMKRDCTTTTVISSNTDSEMKAMRAMMIQLATTRAVLVIESNHVSAPFVSSCFLFLFLARFYIY
jgi:hypothetical protein